MNTWAAEDDAALAEELAGRTGELLLSVRGGTPASGADRADAQADRFLGEELSRRRPDDCVLSEESPDDPARLRCRRVWIVDPLDGTREYGEPGRTDWAVHVALWEDGQLRAGAVALPALGVVYSTGGQMRPPAVPSGRSPSAPSGGQMRRPAVPSGRSPSAPSGSRAPLAGNGQPRRIAVSRTRPPAYAAPVAAALGAELVGMGSAGAKVAAVLRGDVDAYLHDGGQHEWDSAAPVAVATAAGLHASRVDGTALCYNQPNPWSPDLLVCRPELAGRMVDLVNRHREETVR